MIRRREKEGVIKSQRRVVGQRSLTKSGVRTQRRDVIRDTAELGEEAVAGLGVPKRVDKSNLR